MNYVSITVHKETSGNYSGLIRYSPLQTNTEIIMSFFKANFILHVFSKYRLYFYTKSV